SSPALKIIPPRFEVLCLYFRFPVRSVRPSNNTFAAYSQNVVNNRTAQRLNTWKLWMKLAMLQLRKSTPQQLPSRSPSLNHKCLFLFFPQFRQRGVVFESAGVADEFFAGGDVAQQPSHDFAAAGFRQRRGEAD